MVLNIGVRFQATNARGATPPCAASRQCSRLMRIAPAQRHIPVARRVQMRASEQKPSAPSKSVHEILAEATALLVDVGGESGIPALMSSIEELEDLGYVCDASGCVMVLPGRLEELGASQALGNTLLQGANWKIGMVMDPSDSQFPAVVSGAGWTIPLTATELSQFIEVLQRLRSVVTSLQSEGQWLPGSGDRPISRAKWDAGRIFMQAVYATANGQPCFALEFTFKTPTGRPLQASWPADVVAAIQQALDAELGVPAPSKSEPATANA